MSASRTNFRSSNSSSKAKPRKNITEDELNGLNNRVISGHDRGFTGDDIDMVSMAQRMATNAGKGSSAFEGQLMQLGELQELLPSSSPSKAAKEKQANEEHLDDNEEEEKDSLLCAIDIPSLQNLPRSSRHLVHVQCFVCRTRKRRMQPQRRTRPSGWTWSEPSADR